MFNRVSICLSGGPTTGFTMFLFLSFCCGFDLRQLLSTRTHGFDSTEVAQPGLEEVTR